VFTHLGWVDVLHGHCSWSVSVGGGDGVIIIVPLWGLASWTLVILKVAINMAHSDEPFTGHISGPCLCELAGVLWVLWTGIWGAWAVGCGFGERDGGGRKQGE